MKLLFTTLCFTSLLIAGNALSPQEEMAKMRAEFEAAKLVQANEFNDYKTNMEKAYQDYKAELKKYWENPELSSQKEWVSYSPDKKSRSKVDFEKNVVVVEVIAKDKKEAKKLLKKRLKYVVSKNTKEVVQTDPLQKKIAELPKEKKIVTAPINAKPILQTVLFDKKPTPKELDTYSEKTIKKHKVETKKSKHGHDNVYTLTIPLPKNSTLKRSKVYKEEIVKNANKYDIPIPLVFAIMQTESDFNPFAKSHIPAFGLMQIVPKSAGKDVYRFLYKKDGMPSASYLYNSDNNIQMGSVYLHILYYRYLKKIKNPESRLYCSIAAYNTGAGNIAWAFTRKHNMNRAAPKINAMSPDEVYNHLLSNLRYDEPKHYLKRVKKRMSAYKKAYKL